MTGTMAGTMAGTMTGKSALALILILVMTAFVPPVQAEPVWAAPVQSGQSGYGLIFVYRASCPFSRRISPALKTIAERYRLPVLAVTTDEYRLGEWPGTRPDEGRAARLGITRVPFVGLFNGNTNTLIPITRRALRPDRLHRRIVAALRAADSQAGDPQAADPQAADHQAGAAP